MLIRYWGLVLVLISTNVFGQTYNSNLLKYREKYKSDFLEDKSSPLKKEDLAYLRFYVPDSGYVVKAKVKLLGDNKPFIMPVFEGNGRNHTRYAVLQFQLKGKNFNLMVYKDEALANNPEYKDYLFLPFTDETNGLTSFEGGRYLDFKEGDIKNGELVLDFNKAYNPYCAYGHGYSCPKPPSENQLRIKIEAGEQKFSRKS